MTSYLASIVYGTVRTNATAQGLMRKGMAFLMEKYPDLGVTASVEVCHRVIPRVMGITKGEILLEEALQKKSVRKAIDRANALARGGVRPPWWRRLLRALSCVTSPEWQLPAK